MSMILTKAALALKNKNNVEVVKFESHKPKKKVTEQLTKSDVPLQQKPSKDLDLKRIRHEVVKFGMSGFSAHKKEEAKIALAVSLGAKPPKNEYINYKQLMERRKKEKRKNDEERKQMMSKSILQSGVKKKKNPKHDVGHLLSSYGKVQKKDLKKDESGKKKKKKQ